MTASTKPFKDGLVLKSNEPSRSSGDEPRDEWTSNTAFLFASIGAAIGLGNIVRFPFLAFKHGGAAFLIPYILAWLFVGIPILGLEFMLGQRMRQHGAIRSLGLVHARAWGIGAVAVFTAVLVMLTYNVVMSWSWVFLVNSFRTSLPWGTNLDVATKFFANNVQGMDANYAACGIHKSGNDTCGLGDIQWPLVLGLGVQYLLLFFALSSGKKLISKVVMWTMPLPFVMLCIIFFYALTLDGAWAGVQTYIGKLDISKLNNGDPWVDAVGQIFFGLSLAIGGMVAYGAAQPSDSKVVKNTWIVSLANSLFSFFSGFAMFMVIGFLAEQEGNTIESYENQLGGYSLAFVTFPTALNLLPHGAAQFLCVLFFLMLILLGFDSAMNLIESVVGALKDYSPACERNERALVGGICAFGFLLGLMFCTQGGEVVMDIIDHFSSTYCLLLVGFLECVVVGWVYDLVPIDEASAVLMEGPAKDADSLPSDATVAAVGSSGKIDPRVPPLLDSSLPAYDRFVKHGIFSCRLQREIAHMTGQDPNYLPFAWSILIKFFTPTVILGLMIYNIKADAETSYNGYPRWATGVFGWFFCLAVPVLMLVVSLVKPMSNKVGTKEDPAPVAAVAGASCKFVEEAN